MKNVPLTEQNLSVAAPEYVWDVAGNTETHDFTLEPVLQLLRRRRPNRILDLGCGNGSFAALLASDGYRVDGCDGSTSGIDVARRNYPDLSFWQQDFADDLGPQFRGKYDAVVSTEVIEHLLLPRRLMSLARSALRPGGLFIVSAPYHGYLKNLALAVTNKFDDHWHPLRDFGHVKFFSRSTLTSLFEESGFGNLTYSTVGRIPLLARSMLVSGTAPL